MVEEKEVKVEEEKEAEVEEEKKVPSEEIGVALVEETEEIEVEEKREAAEETEAVIEVAVVEMKMTSSMLNQCKLIILIKSSSVLNIKSSKTSMKQKAKQELIMGRDKVSK